MPDLLTEAKEQAQARKHRVLVYGTLRRGQGNNAMLKDSKFLGAVVIPKDEGLVMMDATQGGFPVVVPAKDAKLEPTVIMAELYAVDDNTLKLLDRLEGVPTMYQQKKIKVRNRGQDVTAIMYQGTKGFFDFDLAYQIEDGNWLTRSRQVDKWEEEQQAQVIQQRATGKGGNYQQITIASREGSAEGYVVDSSAENVRNWLESEVGADQSKLLERYGRIAVFKSMRVERRLRGRGIGNKLVDDWLARADRYGAEAIFLIADKGEQQAPGFDLQKWYESWGFEKVADTSGGPFMVMDLDQPQQQPDDDDDVPAVPDDQPEHPSDVPGELNR